MKNSYFDEKLRKIYNRVTSNKRQPVGAQKKLNDQITYYTKLKNSLAKEVKETNKTFDK